MGAADGVVATWDVAGCGVPPDWLAGFWVGCTVEGKTEEAEAPPPPPPIEEPVPRALDVATPPDDVFAAAPAGSERHIAARDARVRGPTAPYPFVVGEPEHNLMREH